MTDRDNPYGTKAYNTRRAPPPPPKPVQVDNHDEAIATLFAELDASRRETEDLRDRLKDVEGRATAAEVTAGILQNSMPDRIDRFRKESERATEKYQKETHRKLGMIRSETETTLKEMGETLRATKATAIAAQKRSTKAMVGTERNSRILIGLGHLYTFLKFLSNHKGKIATGGGGSVLLAILTWIGSKFLGF